jgi:hypothetical protein
MYDLELSRQYPEDEDGDGRRNVVFSPFNHLTRLVAREDFIILDRYPLYMNGIISVRAKYF